MAEVKNAFIKSKMNQDLDARLLPSGEYREGFNIQVSKSEGPDVGALENVLGNQMLATSQQDLEQLTGLSTIIIIGAYVDKSSDTLFLFITDNTGSEKYNPNANNFVYSFNVTSELYTRLLTGNFLNFHVNYPIIGINLLENLLFFTDNRNQPRKININNIKAGSNDSLYYTNEDQISVAKYNPYQAINLYKYQKDPVPYGGEGFVTTMQDVVSEKLPDGTTDNPYYNEKYPGDEDFLQDKFVRFGYRFKFEDGEYSVFSTFTQEAFIPQQDGYFLGNTQYTSDPNITDDEGNTYRSGEVSFMINKANQIELIIPLESESFIEAQNIVEVDILYKESDGLAVQVVDTLDLSYINKQREVSPGVFEYINKKEYAGNWFLQYTYQGRKPYKTLPESQLLRVFDKIPVKAFGQEVSGNRIIYSNFQDKHTPPINLNYNVAVTNKYQFEADQPGQLINSTQYRTSIVEYPEHTVKQDRNYQVGIVLSDRYGRTSSVLLSSVDSFSDENEGIFYGSTVFNKYINKSQFDSDYAPNDWQGDSIKLIFNDTINTAPNPITLYPGVYNGDSTKPEYNPLGWYSYKVVVKQLEQEYYNVYLPGILEGDPNAATTAGNPTGTIATIPLIGDNVNKIPKELTNVNPTQEQFTSSTVLFPRVTANFVNGNDPTFNEAFFPTSRGVNVAALGDYRDLLREKNGDPIDALPDVYESTTNPLVARLATADSGVAYSSDILGSFPSTQPTQPYPFYLSVLETNPVVSRIELYYETSTSGIIQDLNLATIEGEDIPTDLINWDFNLNESDPVGTAITDPFHLQTTDPIFGLIEAKDVTLNSWNVFDESGNDRFNDFEVIKINKNTQDLNGNATNYDRFYLKSNNTFVFTSESIGASGSFVFDFNFSLTGETVSENFAREGDLGNAAPVILATDGSANLPTSIQIDSSVVDIYQFTGKNGSVSQNQGDRIIDLFWSIISGNESGNFNITANGLLQAIGDNVTGSFNLTIQLEDGGGASDTYLLNITSDVIPNLTFTNDNFWCTPIAPITLSTGNGSSSGFYWTSSADNAQLNEPYLRSVTPSLQLPSLLSGYDTRSQTAQQSGCGMFTFSNTNFTSKGNYTDNLVVNQSPQANTNLQSGTAFVQVTANTRQPYYSDASGSGIGQGCINGFDGLLKVTFPIVLQYRDPNSSSYPNNWVTAIDTEGVDCTFGGEQQTSSNPRLAYNNNFGFSKSGVLVERNISSLSTPGGNPGDTSQVNIQMFKEGLDSWQQPYEQTGGGDNIENGEQQVSGWTISVKNGGEIINPSTFKRIPVNMVTTQSAIRFFDLYLTRNNSNATTPFTVTVRVNGEDAVTKYVTNNNFNNSYKLNLINVDAPLGSLFTVFIEADSDISFNEIKYELIDGRSGQARTISEFPTSFEYVATSSTDAVYTTVLASESKLTKTFAFGRDQYYNERPDRFGDYRLIVRYPFGDYPAPVSSTCGGNGLATVTPTGCPDNDVFKSTNNIDFSDVKMQYGDFYNPVAAGKPCLPTEYSDIINPSSYEYKISTIPTNNTDENTAVELASRILPTRTVYAREWHCKYITKLYTDAALQNEVTNLVSGWYSYSLATDVSRVETSGAQSYDFVLSQNDRSHSQERGATVASIDSNEERRWVAYFANGVKRAASAVPNIFGTTGFSDIDDDNDDACVGVNIYPQNYFDNENQFDGQEKTLVYTTCGGVPSIIIFGPNGIIGQNTQEYFTVCLDRTKLITVDNQQIDPEIDSDSDCSSGLFDSDLNKRTD